MPGAPPHAGRASAPGCADDLQHQPVVIAERDHLLDVGATGPRFAGPSMTIAVAHAAAPPRSRAPPGSTAKDVTATCPGPCRPRRAPGQGKNVMMLPGVPTSSP